MSTTNHRAIRVGAIGAGRVFTRLYLPALGRQASLELASAADPARPTIPGVAVYATEAELFRATRLDALLVLSPPSLHAAHVAAGVARGLHVLVEKPPALTTAEVDAWPSAGPASVTPAFSRRFWKRYSGAKRAGAKWRFTLKTDPERWGAVQPDPVERDLLPHAADLAGWLSGERIVAVEEVARTRKSASGLFRLSAGGEFRWDVAHGNQYVEQLTVDGRVLGGAPGVLESLGDRVLRRPPQDVGGVARLLVEWAAMLKGSPAPSLPTVDDARACAAVIEAVEREPVQDRA
ncbi:MAG: Gfo/Idh/MocA family oxidoreductase [Dehalococcoidia bacterium]|nr:Gfo/Idh/MocA family oxidoreductase [Dehalococcoidia bacterium]